VAKPIIGCGQITWRNVTGEEILRDIAAAGYEGAPGPLTLEVPATDVIERFARHGLRPAPPYFSAHFHDTAAEETILGQARDVARYTRALGCTELYVAASGEPARAKVAGHVGLGDAMPDEAFGQFARVLSAFGRITLEEGVHSCFHNHVGTVIETADELDRMLSRADRETVFLGLDTGHLAWAGEDAVAVCRHYADRIRTLHLKDVDEAVRREGAAKAWDYATFTAHGIFAELGEGSVDFPALLADQEARSFDGWLIVETDVTQKPTALESATISRVYLRTLGL
jgi:inosose dehydratase